MSIKRLTQWLLVSCLLLITCFLFSCQGNKKEGELTVKTLKWSGQKSFEIKDIIKEITYIKLEDNAESALSGIGKLIIKNERIYILDTDIKSLLVFDINGQFLHRVGKQGRGPGEYVRYINFSVNDNGEVFIYDMSNRNIMIYDTSGKYIRSIESSISFSDFFILNDKYLLASTANIYVEPKKLDKVILTPDFIEQERTYLKYDKEYIGGMSGYQNFLPYGDKIAYMYPISDTLYLFNKKGVPEYAYFFDFGARKLPAELKNDYEKYREGEKIYTYIDSTPICIGNYIFAEMYVDNKQCIAVYDIANNRSTYEVVSPENFSVDNVNLPLYAISDSHIVSYLDGNVFYLVKDFSINQELDVHLSNGGIVLCLYEIYKS